MSVETIIFFAIIVTFFIYMAIFLIISDHKEKVLRQKEDEYNKTHLEEYALYLDADDRLEYLLSCYSSLYKNPLSCQDYEEYQSKMKELWTQINRKRQIMDRYEKERAESVKGGNKK